MPYLAWRGLTVALISVLVVVIFARILGGGAPGGGKSTLSAFTLPGGVDFGTLGLATVFGILSFAGFEGAASLGEETDNPRRNIPRAIAAAVVTMGIFYVIVMLAQTLGFGVDERGTEGFAGASSPLGELSTSYIGPPMAAAINFGVMVSAFASALGTATAGSRMLYSLCRDGFLSRRLGETSERTGAPVNALAVVMVVGITTFVLMRLGGVSAVNAFFYPATVGVLTLLVAYIVTNAGALRFLLSKKGTDLGGHLPGYRAWHPRLRNLQERVSAAGLPFQPLPLHRCGLAPDRTRHRVAGPWPRAPHRCEPRRA